MNRILLGVVCALAGATALVSQTLAQPTASVSSWVVPARELPVPSTVSPQMQAVISRPPSERRGVGPQTAAEWKAMVARVSEGDSARVAVLRKTFNVDFQAQTIAGVPCYVITPRNMPAKNRNRLLVNVHGGGFVFGPGEGGAAEAIMVAGVAQMKVIAIDYRMPPDFPFPAAMDDAMAVWRQVVKEYDPKRIGIFGTSTGGGMTLAMVQRAKLEGLPGPAAIFAGTPWSDLSKTGDSYFTNAGVDNGLVTYEGLLEGSAKIYANGQDLKDARLSPIYGSFEGFPPTILVTGTRDLFLSNTVRVQLKLIEAGVPHELDVYEGQSHAQYLLNPESPETKIALGQVAKFFDAQLAR